MDRDPPVVSPQTDQERAAWLATQRREPGLAVVDDNGRFQGLIPPDRLAAILLQGARRGPRPAGRLPGLDRACPHREPGKRTSATVAPDPVACGRARRRDLVGRDAGGLEEQISTNLTVAYFIFGIVYLADAVGTQTETLAIRGLSVGVGIGRIIGREAVTGLLSGALAAAMLPPSPGCGRTPRWPWRCRCRCWRRARSPRWWPWRCPGCCSARPDPPALATVLQDLLSIMIYPVVTLPL